MAIQSVKLYLSDQGTRQLPVVTYQAKSKGIIMLTKHCKPEMKTFYHGSSTHANIENMLLPPCDSGTISEKGRKKNLDKVFFTTDKGLAKIYAGRASNSVGGIGILYRVVMPANVTCMNSTKGASVYQADYAFVELLETV